MKSDKDLYRIFMRIIECMEADNLCRFPVSFVEFELAKEHISSLVSHGYFCDIDYVTIDSPFWIMAAGEETEALEYFNKDTESFLRLHNILDQIFNNTFRE